MLQSPNLTVWEKKDSKLDSKVVKQAYTMRTSKNI